MIQLGEATGKICAQKMSNSDDLELLCGVGPRAAAKCDSAVARPLAPLVVPVLGLRTGGARQGCARRGWYTILPGGIQTATAPDASSRDKLSRPVESRSQDRPTMQFQQMPSSRRVTMYGVAPSARKAGGSAHELRWRGG